MFWAQNVCTYQMNTRETLLVLGFHLLLGSAYHTEEAFGHWHGAVQWFGSAATIRTVDSNTHFRAEVEFVRALFCIGRCSPNVEMTELSADQWIQRRWDAGDVRFASAANTDAPVGATTLKTVLVRYGHYID